MVPLLSFLCCALAILQLSSGQVFSPGARNFGPGFGNIGANNIARNIGNFGGSGLGSGVRGSPGTLIATNDASSRSGRISGTIGTRIVPGNFDFGNLRSRLNKEFGLQVASEGLGVEGNLAVNGRMPLVGTVEVSGSVPTDGAASVNYSCGGNGNTVNNVNRL